jgi:PAS domain S-box-containing protein
MYIADGKTEAQWSHRRILVTILLTSFVVETCAMFLLPVLLPSNVLPWIEALADATLLSIGSLPLLWFLLIRPMHADMRKSARHTRLLMTALDEHALVSIADAEGRITHANDAFCRTSHFTREELVGQDHRVLNSGHHPKSFMKNLWDTINRGDLWHGEVCNRAKGGALYWVGLTIVPFKDEAGHITHHVAIRANITERKRLEEALKTSKTQADAANLAKSEFLANMSHEIRTPMTAILGFAENMLDAEQSESEKLNCAHTIRRNGEYLIGLIDDILDLSKVEAGKMTVEKSNCQPCRIIAEVVSLMRVRADAKGLPFNIEYIGAIPETIQTDPTRLRQILINMVGNAIKFTEMGAVRLVTRFVERDDTPSLQFDVIDTGRGLTDEQVAKLFRPFMQADSSTTRKFGGTGLGLTISKRFAELLGGDITVASTDLGVGTTFRARIATGSLDGVTMLENPLSATVVEDSANTVLQVTQSDLHGLRILLAEDGPDNQRLISFVLKKAGANVTVEENGKLALDTALAASGEGKPFDAILMDMQMPVMDGYEATGQLRQKGCTGPIIALTAHAMASDREKCIKAGCDDYATKPIDRKKLIETIQRNLVTAEGASAENGTGEAPFARTGNAN